jgi:hypothetical protein
MTKLKWQGGVVLAFRHLAFICSLDFDIWIYLQFRIL